MFIIFLHLHKCGGMSFVNLLNQKYKLPHPDNGLFEGGGYTPKTKKEMIDFIDKLKTLGFEGVVFEWGCPIITNLENVKYICIFRNPIKRLISNYYYDKGLPHLKFLNNFDDYLELWKKEKTYYYNFNCYYEFFKDYENQEINEIMEKIKKIDFILNLDDIETFSKIAEIGLDHSKMIKKNTSKKDNKKDEIILHYDLKNKCHLDIEIFKLLSSYF